MVELQDERFEIVGSALEVGVGMGEDVEGVDKEKLDTEDSIAEKIAGSGIGEVSVDDSHWKRIESEVLCSDFGGTCSEREH
jgi:hypothetical protein